MKKTEIKILFNDCTSNISIEIEKKESTLEVLKQNIREKELEPTISGWAIIKNQLKYMDKDVLLIQASLFFIIIMGMTGLDKNSINDLSYFKFGTGVVSWIGFFVTYGVAKQYTNHFVELGETCYFNGKQIIALRMLLSGILDAILLFMLMIIISQKTEKNLMETGIYLLVPFLMSGCVYVGVLLTEAGRRNTGLLAGISLLLIVIFSTFSSFPILYEKALITVWYFVLALVSLMLAAEITLYFTKIRKGDILCAP